VGDKNLSKNLFNLAIAGLISEAEFENFSDELLLKVPIERKKTIYLTDVLKEANLKRNLKIEPIKGQFTIHSHSFLTRLKEQWYKGNTKIFSNILDPNLINLQSIIICINLFGSRKLETISIPTNIDRNYIKAVSFCIEHHLKVPVIPGTNQIKITNIPQFILSTLADIPAIHSVELINFLTDKEKKKLMEGGSI
jgi:hypothetical protein